MSERWRPKGYEDQDIGAGCAVGMLWLFGGGGLLLLFIAKVMAVMGW